MDNCSIPAKASLPTFSSQRLKHLERAGIVERQDSTHPRSRYDYRLSDAGLKLAPAVRALAEWGPQRDRGHAPAAAAGAPARPEGSNGPTTLDRRLANDRFGT